MGKPCSSDLRERICGYIAAGHYRGSVPPRQQGRAPGTAGKLKPYIAFLVVIVRAEPDITLKELAGALEETHGVLGQLSSVHRALIRAGFSDKNGLIAQERTRADIRLARHDWTVRGQPFMRERTQRLVFIDETSVKANMTRLRGRSAVGERLFGVAPLDRWQTKHSLPVSLARR